MAEDGGGHPVAHPVDINQLAALRQAVDGADVHVRGGGQGKAVLVPVPDGVVVGGQLGVQPHLLHGHRAAEGHAYPVDLAVQIGGGLLLSGEAGDGVAPFFQVFRELVPVYHDKILL